MRTSVFNPLIFGLFLCVMLMPGHHVHAQSSLYSLNEDGLPYFFTPAEFAPLQTGTFNVVSCSVSQRPLAASIATGLSAGFLTGRSRQAEKMN